MYNPLIYKTVEELIGTIETDRVVLANKDGAYLQYGEIWGGDLIPGKVRTWSAKLDEDALAFTIAAFADKDVDTETKALYVWADRMFLQSDYDSLESFADYLITQGLATVYNYAPEAAPADEPVPEPDEEEEDGTDEEDEE